MMPLADAFNHKAAKVKLSGGFEIAPLCQPSDGEDSTQGVPPGPAAECSSSSSRRPATLMHTWLMLRVLRTQGRSPRAQRTMREGQGSARRLQSHLRAAQVARGAQQSGHA